MQSFTVRSGSPADTAAIARSIAPVLRAGDVVLLNGDLAAGKTLFVGALASALGCADAVTSPTFSIANFHTYPGGQILHMDAYRLAGVAEFRELALEDYMAQSITLIEWGERIAAALAETLNVAFAIEGSARALTFTAHGPRWTGAMTDLASRTGA